MWEASSLLPASSSSRQARAAAGPGAHRGRGHPTLCSPAVGFDPAVSSALIVPGTLPSSSLRGCDHVDPPPFPPLLGQTRNWGPNIHPREHPGPPLEMFLPPLCPPHPQGHLSPHLGFPTFAYPISGALTTPEITGIWEAAASASPKPQPLVLQGTSWSQHHPAPTPGLWGNQ